MQNAMSPVKSELCTLRDDFGRLPAQTANMPKETKQANHLKAWREFRGLTQKELGELAGTTGSVISLLEGGDRRLSDKWLRRLAPHLKINPGALLEHDPESLPTNILEVWADIPDERKDQAMEILQTFRKAAG